MTLQRWRSCEGGTEVEFVTVSGASHAWMGHPGTPILDELTGRPYMDYDSSFAIWELLAAHPSS